MRSVLVGFICLSAGWGCDVAAGPAASTPKADPRPSQVGRTLLADCGGNHRVEVLWFDSGGAGLGGWLAEGEAALQTGRLVSDADAPQGTRRLRPADVTSLPAFTSIRGGLALESITLGADFVEAQWVDPLEDVQGVVRQDGCRFDPGTLERLDATLTDRAYPLSYCVEDWPEADRGVRYSLRAFLIVDASGAARAIMGFAATDQYESYFAGDIQSVEGLPGALDVDIANGVFSVPGAAFRSRWRGLHLADEGVLRTRLDVGFVDIDRLQEGSSSIGFTTPVDGTDYGRCMFVRNAEKLAPDVNFFRR